MYDEIFTAPSASAAHGRATEEISSLRQMLESRKEQAGLLKVLRDLEGQMVTLTSGFISKTETQKKPELKSLQKGPVLAFPLSLHSGATHAAPAAAEESPDEIEGEEEGEIGD